MPDIVSSYEWTLANTARARARAPTVPTNGKRARQEKKKKRSMMQPPSRDIVAEK